MTPLLIQTISVIIEVCFGERDHHMHSQYSFPRMCPFWIGVLSRESFREGPLVHGLWRQWAFHHNDLSWQWPFKTGFTVNLHLNFVLYFMCHLLLYQGIEVMENNWNWGNSHGDPSNTFNILCQIGLRLFWHLYRNKAAYIQCIAPRKLYYSI